jgi:hypothetical protein
MYQCQECGKKIPAKQAERTGECPECGGSDIDLADESSTPLTTIFRRNERQLGRCLDSDETTVSVDPRYIRVDPRYIES